MDFLKPKNHVQNTIKKLEKVFKESWRKPFIQKYKSMLEEWEFHIIKHVLKRSKELPLHLQMCNDAKTWENKKTLQSEDHQAQRVVEIKIKEILKFQTG